MNTYVITLERSKQRSNYIKKHAINRGLDFQIVPAIDGLLLKQIDIEKTCNVEIVNRHRYWLTNGAIGCALSHLKAYNEFLRTDRESAFIIEDDVLLPKNIKNILSEIDREIKTNEIILLYYVSFKPAFFSSKGKINLSEGGLYYPIDINQPITAAAYIIGREAALNLSKMIIPIQVAADSWGYYYSKGAFNSMRVLFPSPILTKNFKSTIDYLKKGSLKQVVSEIINEYKIPIFYNILKFIRKRNLSKMLNHFTIIDDPSPIDPLI